MTRKLFTFALALLTAASAWAYDFKSGDLYYNITNASNKTVEVTYEYELDPSNYSSLPGAVSIPETVSYNGINYSVTSIGNSAFYYCSALTQVNIPESVTSIGNSAFESCYKLTQVTIPDGVTSIGNSAFSYCYALTQVSIPNGVTNIGEGAFSICLALTAINVEGSNTTYCSENGILFNKGKTTLVCYPAGKPETVYAIPNSVTSIGSSAFFGCSRLTQVNIPDGVKSIGDGAFFGSFALTQVDIPNSVTSIGDYAFAECSALIDINVGSGNTTYCSENSVLFNKDKTTLVCYPADKPETVYAIPNSVTSIGDWAFFRCSRLTQVNIPSSVTSIGSQAFQHCDALTQVNIPSSVTSIGDWAFAYCSKLRQMNIPGSVTSIGEWVFYGCSSLTQVTIPESVTSIGQWAFGGCDALTQVTWNAINCNSNAPCYDISSNITNFIFGNQVEHIPAYLCYGMDKLTQVTLPESVTSIGEWVFYGCSSLTQVTIPESVTSIGQWAFSGCDALKQVAWNAINCADFTNYEYSPFYGISTNITNFTFGEQVEHIPALLCYGMEKLTQVTLPNSVTSIGDGAFYGCFALTQVTIGSGVTSIGDYAFEDCSSLTQVTIPNNVESIGNSAFYNCSALTAVYYTGDVAEWCGITFSTYSSNPLYYAHKLYIDNTLVTRLNIPDDITEIKDYAFYNCRALTQVNIPDGVTSIGNGAFTYCSALTEMTVLATVPPTVGYDAFYNVSRNIPVYVPAEALDAYQAAETWKEFNYLQDMPTSLQTPSMPESIRVYGGLLHNPQGLPVSIYDMQGRMVYSGTAATVSQPAGVYVVRCAGAGASSKVLF